MSAPSEQHSPAVSIRRHSCDPPIRVRVKRFVEFAREIDAGLERLVARWEPWAAPRSGRHRRPR